MLEIVKENVEDSYKIFLEELERLKSVPLKEDDKVIYEKIEVVKKVGFLKRKSVIETQNGNILKKGDYISLLGLCNTIGKYLEKIYSIRSKLLYELDKAYGFHIRDKFSIKFEDSMLSILSKDEGIIIDCNVLPKLVLDSDAKYSYLKDTIFEYLPYILQYKKIINILKNNYNINEYTTLKIEADDMLNKKEITVILQFGEFAVYEIRIVGTDDGYSKYTNTFSLDTSVNTYLSDNKDEMLENIYIKESDISDILDIF